MSVGYRILSGFLSRAARWAENSCVGRISRTACCSPGIAKDADRSERERVQTSCGGETTGFLAFHSWGIALWQVPFQELHVPHMGGASGLPGLMVDCHRHVRHQQVSSRQGRTWIQTPPRPPSCKASASQAYPFPSPHRRRFRLAPRQVAAAQSP